MNEQLKGVQPFYVEVVDKKDGKIIVQMPESLFLGGNKMCLDCCSKRLLVDPGKNSQHNIRRDVRAMLRQEGIVVTFKQQEKTILIR